MKSIYATEQDIQAAFESGRISDAAAVEYLREIRYAAGGNVTYAVAWDTVSGWSRFT